MIDITQDEIMKNWDKNNFDSPIVSVRCITYNQESYIAQALDGFLMQKTTFPLEVIVHDDASCDKMQILFVIMNQRFQKLSNQFKYEKVIFNLFISIL